MMLGDHIAAEALALLGVPFRLRGRSVETGLDCVGLVMMALRGAGRPVIEPPRYGLRGMSVERAEALLRQAGLRPTDGAAAGDILLARSGPMQLHLMIRTGRGHVQAHAGLGRVVLMPPTLPRPDAWRASEEG